MCGKRSTQSVQIWHFQEKDTLKVSRKKHSEGTERKKSSKVFPKKSQAGWCVGRRKVVFWTALRSAFSPIMGTVGLKPRAEKWGWNHFDGKMGEMETMRMGQEKWGKWRKMGTRFWKNGENAIHFSPFPPHFSPFFRGGWTGAETEDPLNGAETTGAETGPA